MPRYEERGSGARSNPKPKSKPSDHFGSSGARTNPNPRPNPPTPPKGK